MSQVPADLLYAKSHEWLRIAPDGTALVGITDHAQSSLGDITFVQLPKVGAVLKAGDTFGVVESVKAASEIYSPVSGEIIEVNAELENAPELVNQDAFGAGWMFKVKLSAQPAGLMDAEAYGAHCAEEAH